MDIQGATPLKGDPQSSNKPDALQKELAQQFSNALKNASQLHGQILAAEESHKQKLRKKKDNIEDGKGMESEEAELEKSLSNLKRKLKNILEQERKNLGL